MDALTRKLTPAAHIRKNVLDLTQAEFAIIAGVTQPTVCRWEQGELEPGVEEFRKIRQAVLDRGAEWSDAWVLATSVEPSVAA